MRKSCRGEGAKNVLVSMAGEGAVLIDENGRESVSPVPKGKVVNAVGARRLDGSGLSRRIP